MTADDKAAVRDALTAFHAAILKGDLSSALDLCTDDVVFIGSGEGEETIGQDAFAASFAAFRPPDTDEVEVTLGWDAVDVDVRGDIALLAAWGAGRVVTSGRTEVERYRYRLTGVLLRSGGRWLWRVHHGSEPVAS